MGNYTHLHGHTIFSKLDGHALVDEYVATAKAQGHTHVGITDHGTLAAIPAFVSACEAHAITPIVGMEAYVEPEGATKRDTDHKHNYHLTLLAINQTGYQNLMRLATFSATEGFYHRARIDWSLLTQHHEGLVALSGCIAGELPDALRRDDPERAKRTLDFYQELFGPERYFLEFQNHGESFTDQQKVNRALYQIAYERGLRVVATNDSHFCHPDEYLAQKLLIGIHTNKKIEDEEGLKNSRYAYIRSNDEMVAAFGEGPLLTNSQLIASMVTPYALGDRTPKLPPSPLERLGEAPTQTLIALSRAGLERRLRCSFGEIPDVYRARLETELDVIVKLSEALGADFGRYLLMIADICGYCRAHEIRFGPRGSAAGSLICWALGISEPDPIRDGLYFERFLNPFRVELPDVDLDFADDKRDEVFAYIARVYGEQNVAKIGTYAVIGAKQALKDSARGLQTKFSLYDGGHRHASDQLIALIPGDPRPGGIPLHELMADPQGRGKPINDLIQTPGQEVLAELVHNALQIEGRLRGEGMHAAGVVIADRALEQILPLAATKDAQAGKPGPIARQTQYEMGHLEKLGLLKVDILGLKTLSVLDGALRRINQYADDFSPPVDPWAIPWDDEATWQLIKSGKTLSLFQIGSEGLGGACFQLQPDSIEDLALTVAVYRPGPMGNFAEIVARKHGKSEIESIHPSIDPILKSTYGFPVYQEQVMEIARAFAGYSLGEADLLRKAMGKKIREKMAAEQVKFFAGAKAKGYDQADAERIWGFLLPFADYGFNRAHAICYAYVAYQTAYLKANYTQSFYSAALTVEATTGGDATPQQRIGNLVREARSLGLAIAPPSIQAPAVGFEPEGDGLRYGLACIKGVGLKEAQEITQVVKTGGPFQGVRDFVFRCPEVRRGALETLVKVGAVPWFTRKGLADVRQVVGPRGGVKELSLIGELVAQRAKARKSVEPGQLALFETTLQIGDDHDLTVDPQEWPASELLLLEQQHLGIFTTPLPEHRGELIADLYDDLPANGGTGHFENAKVHLMGVVTQFVQHVTKKSNLPMGYLQLLDETGAGFDCVIFPKTFARLQGDPSTSRLLREGMLVHVTGAVKTDPVGRRRLFLDHLWSETEAEEEALPAAPAQENLPRRRVRLGRIDADSLGELTELYQVAAQHPGEHIVEIICGETVDLIRVSAYALALLDDRLVA